MKNWEKFELNTLNYLRQNINIKNVFIKGIGGGNSHENDIEIYFKKKKLFSIETKLSPSQSGQIVIYENNSKYVLSQNMVFDNKYSNEIIEYLNDNFQETKINNFELKCSKDLIFRWIKNHYKEKGVFFIITSNSIDDDYSILKIDDIQTKFCVSGILRRKKSGTSHLPKKELNISTELKSFLKTKNIESEIITEGKKTSLITNQEIKDEYLYFKENYFLSKTSYNIRHKYNLKKRSKTNNLNVVFNLRYIGEGENSGINLLKSEILKIIKQN